MDPDQDRRFVGPDLGLNCFTLASNLGYLASPRTIFHGCQIVHWDPWNVKRWCPKKIAMGYVKMHGFHGKLDAGVFAKVLSRQQKF